MLSKLYDNKTKAIVYLDIHSAKQDNNFSTLGLLYDYTILRDDNQNDSGIYEIYQKVLFQNLKDGTWDHFEPCKTCNCPFCKKLYNIITPFTE